MVGGLVLAVAFGLLRLWLGLAVLGGECILFGLAMSMGSPPQSDDGA